jgi:hypothetical protein
MAARTKMSHRIDDGSEHQSDDTTARRDVLGILQEGARSALLAAIRSLCRAATASMHAHHHAGY